jgi:membrane glycosyltransferase
MGAAACTTGGETDNIGHKSGNIQDFCKHWGDGYRYMITLDADSLMTEQAFLEMVRRMENDPRIGILQSLPVPVNRRSLFGRLQQFAAQMYGPVFTPVIPCGRRWKARTGGTTPSFASVRSWIPADCRSFPGSAPLGGEILSHDFVEAAFILKHGWKVVVHDDIPGSYEECPANLIDFAKRDQRWCQGNLQHIRLVFQQKLRGLSRAQLGMGAMSYLSSPLWAIFLVLIALAGVGLRGSAAAPDTEAMPAVSLFGATLLLLMLPKFWALLLTMNSTTRIAEFGGPEKAIFGVLFEIAASIVIAPIVMAFHTTFVTAALLGHCVRWEAQPRTDHRVMLAEAFRVHAWHTIAGLSAALLVIGLSPAMFFWIIPVLAAAGAVCAHLDAAWQSAHRRLVIEAWNTGHPAGTPAA